MPTHFSWNPSILLTALLSAYCLGCGSPTPSAESPEAAARREHAEFDAFLRRLAQGATDFDLSRESATDAWLEELQGKPIRSLNLINRSITVAGLESLRGMESLEELYLEGTEVSDPGMEVIGTLKGLTQLQLSHRITSGALSHLEGLTKLQVLSLTEKVDDEGVKYLERLTELRSVGPLGEFVTDAALPGLAGLKKLTVISLSRSKVTNEGLKQLAALPELSSLALDYTGITDEGLEVLAEFPSLRQVNLLGTQVTPAGVKRLREARSELTIIE
jgi:internalin A